MTALDQARPARSPSIWTGELVRQRLVEACVTYRKLPIDRFGGRSTSTSSWPATPLHDWQEMVHWNNPGDGARDRVLESWERAKGAYPIEISRMEESFDWLLWLDQGDRRNLEAWAWASATSKSVRAMLGKRGLKRTTFYRNVNNAAVRIADRLNGQGVQVR